MAEIHVGDVGTSFRVTVKDENDDVVDVSTASTKQFTFKKSDNTTVVKTGDFYTDGTDGIVEYISEDDDLDICGTWKLQVYVVLGSGKWYTSIHEFDVKGNL